MLLYYFCCYLLAIEKSHKSRMVACDRATISLRSHATMRPLALPFLPPQGMVYEW